MTYSMMRFAAYDQVKGLMHKGESSQAFSAIAINTRHAARGQLLACKPLPLPVPHAAARPDLSQNGFSRECAHRGHSSHSRVKPSIRCRSSLSLACVLAPVAALRLWPELRLIALGPAPHGAGGNALAPLSCPI